MSQQKNRPIAPSARQREAARIYVNSAPNAETRARRSAYAQEILNRDPNEPFNLVTAETVTAEPSSEAAAADRAVFRLATEDVRVIIGKYIPPTDGDTPEHRALSLGRFLARCRDNAPNAAVVVILPNANAPNIDAAALDAALRTYFAVSRENAEARQ